jgi:Xaa-Pro dipeptidase
VFQFSDSELARRRTQLLSLANSLGCEGVWAFGENRSGVAVTYLTEWPVTRGAVCALTTFGCDLWVSFHNHVPAARRRARVDSVRDMYTGYLDELFATVKPKTAVGTLGPIPPAVTARAVEHHIALVSLDRDHAILRQRKSAEEVTALELGSAVSDVAAEALISACVEGASDWDLLAAAKNAYTKRGGLDHICYISVTDMARPDRDVPSQFPEGRVLTASSMVTFELSASIVPEYPGQILRTVTLAEPSEHVIALSGIAETCKAAIKGAMRPGVSARELIAHSMAIESAGYSTTDDLFHGFGMGYLEPIATSTSRVPNHSPDLLLEDGMAIVVQPNVTTSDHTLGVQTGELVIVEAEGVRDLHHLPTGLIRAK